MMKETSGFLPLTPRSHSQSPLLFTSSLKFIGGALPFLLSLTISISVVPSLSLSLNGRFPLLFFFPNSGLKADADEARGWGGGGVGVAADDQTSAATAGSASDNGFAN